MNSDNQHVSRQILVFAAVLGALGVLIGAIGAHGIESLLSRPGLHGPAGLDQELMGRRIGQFNVGVRYHLIHAIALLALSAVHIGSPTWRRFSAGLFVGGIILFSGSLYVLVLTNTPWLGAITPIGGLAWIVAWLSLLSLAWSGSSDKVRSSE